MNKYRNRTLEKALKQAIDSFPAIMITGPRQVGKTTLLNYISITSKKKINYVSLDDLFLRKQANEDPELFLRTYEAPLVIDEFQYAPNLLTYIKINIDKHKQDVLFTNKKDIGTLYYLTGSQVFQTMEEASESLAGRIAIFDLYGFSTRELENLKEDVFVPDYKLLKKKTPTDKKSTIKIYERILEGSYPDALNNPKISLEVFYQSYIKTYMERDIRNLINIKNEEKFLRFISVVAARTSQEFNALDIARDVEVDAKTINEWISILKNTHLIYLLPAYSNNNIKKIIKRPKIYFTDTGLAAFLAGYNNVESLLKSSFSGAIFETYIITEIIKSYSNNGIDIRNKLYYYRDKNGKEIDLIINYNNVIYPVEIKKSSNPSKEAIKNFDVVNNFPFDKGTGIVLCMIDEIKALDENNYLIPIEYI